MTRLSNRTLILGFAILAAISLTFGIRNFHKALPEIGIDFKISRKQALQNAKTYLESRQYDLKGFHETITFVSSGGDKIYIEKELGVPRLTSLSEDSISIWKWRARFFKPLQKLEYIAYIDPKGRIVGFQRKIDEAAAGLSLDTTAARLLAEAFLSGPTGIDLDKWELVETNVLDRPNRRDYTFTYELKNFRLKEATYRLTVELQGAEVSQYYYRLREPEDWWRDWEKQRGQNDLFGNIANGLSLLTMVGVFYYFFRHVKKSAIPWKTAIGLGITLAIAQLVMGLNSIPLDLAWFETTGTYGAFMAQEIAQSLFAGLLLGLNLVLLFGAGEYLYRQDYPEKLSLSGIFSRRGMKSKEFFEATLMGYLLCAFDIGFITFYYIVGSKFGFWSPADIKYDESVSTWLPWIYPLAISLYASLTEEFWFRLFGISLFKRLTKSKFLALLIPAMIWAFLHSNYPQQPGYARGIELTIVGVVAGIVMMRFGIWATLVYHYVYDAVLVGLFLFRSQNVYFWTSGLIVCGFVLIPAAIAGIYWLKNRRFENVDDLLNGAIPSEEEKEVITESTPQKILPPPPEILPPVNRSLSPVSRRIALIAGLIGLATLLLPSPRRFGDNFKFTVDQTEAIEKAGAALRDKYGINPDDFKVGIKCYEVEKSVIWGFNSEESDDDYDITYLKAYGTLEQAEKLLEAPYGRPLYDWRVDFKKPLDATFYSVDVPMNGAPLKIYRMIADSIAGPDLPLETAQQISDSLFYSSAVNASAYHRIEERSNKRPNRRDWYFTYETLDTLVGEAKLRQSAVLIENDRRVGAKWIKVPEEWKRKEEKRSTLSAISQGAFALAFILLSIWILRSMGLAMKRGEIDWPSARRVGYFIAGMTLFAALLNQSDFWIEYDTAKPVFAHMSQVVLTVLLLTASMFGFGLVVVALSESLNNNYTGGNRPLLTNPQKWQWDRDDALVLLALTGGMIGLKTLFPWLTDTFKLPVHNWSIELPAFLGSCMPFLSGITAAFSGAIIQACGIFVVIHLLGNITRKRLDHLWIVLLLIVLRIIADLSSAGNWTSGEIAWMAIEVTFTMSAAYFALCIWTPGRLHVLVASSIIAGMFISGVGLTGLTGSSYVLQGWSLAGISAVLFIALLIRGFRERSGTIV